MDYWKAGGGETVTHERWLSLMECKDDSLNLTEEEFNEGWHFCAEWDGLLVGPGMMEYDFCKEIEKDREEEDD